MEENETVEAYQSKSRTEKSVNGYKNETTQEPQKEFIFGKH